MVIGNIIWLDRLLGRCVLRVYKSNLRSGIDYGKHAHIHLLDGTISVPCETVKGPSHIRRAPVSTCIGGHRGAGYGHSDDGLHDRHQSD
jgi:hypothetical protein